MQAASCFFFAASTFALYSANVLIAHRCCLPEDQSLQGEKELALMSLPISVCSCWESRETLCPGKRLLRSWEWT